ncbi:toll/interleukin-1 receptor domain-containing protein [Bordetella genomosp. 11]|uniref:TIR domain-containing protein n=1 Tax=Bordetella genomosp. 11 TaxID=1416808 RepID=A0A261V0L1_9BORD|nr:toll/interleukin-1 receptor domain-containing protein [Bordetella genomosp. 11]OZI67060.1 hypothetical protein CAL28_05010 [Bordetella genomosp. 11]
MMITSDHGELPGFVVGVQEITPESRAAVRRRVAQHFGFTSMDAVLLCEPNGNLAKCEFDAMLENHERAKNLTPMKIFLSHKTADKPLVREFKKVLAEIGFEPWLDEDAMTAGAPLERTILKGFNDSCAAVFFVTPNFVDENFLATEVDYAIAQKRAKEERFEIITLQLSQDGKKGNVPDLLRRFVYKEPSSEAEALYEILRALPIRPHQISWRD